jgi:hypothetical protein
VAVSLRFLPLFFAGLLLFSQPLSGQWTLSGQVVDAESGEGLSYVNILFEGQSHLNTTSNQKGEFKLDALYDEAYDISFLMIGFQTVHLITSPKILFPFASPLSGNLYLRRSGGFRFQENTKP